MNRDAQRLATEQGEIRRALDRMEFPPCVVEHRVAAGQDWGASDAVWVDVVLDDDLSEIKFDRYAGEIGPRVLALLARVTERVPYVEFRREAEQRAVDASNAQENKGRKK